MTWWIYGAAFAMFIIGLLLFKNDRHLQRFIHASDVRGKIKGRFHPITIFIKQIAGSKRAGRADDEICEAISYLRNLISLGQGKVISADAVIEQLADQKGILSPCYGDLLRLFRQNQKDEAVKAFKEGSGSSRGGDFARILMQWDELDPTRLIDTLLSHRHSIMEIRTTARKRRDEILSDIIFFPVVINVMLVFINFIYVGYFIDQQNILSML
jgi:hypothetical protein